VSYPRIVERVVPRAAEDERAAVDAEAKAIEVDIRFARECNTIDVAASNATNGGTAGINFAFMGTTHRLMPDAAAQTRSAEGREGVPCLEGSKGLLRD
jgi:hypothetical protein